MWLRFFLNSRMSEDRASSKKQKLAKQDTISVEHDKKTPKTKVDRPGVFELDSQTRPRFV